MMGLLEVLEVFSFKFWILEFWNLKKDMGIYMHYAYINTKNTDGWVLYVILYI